LLRLHRRTRLATTANSLTGCLCCQTEARLLGMFSWIPPRVEDRVPVPALSRSGPEPDPFGHDAGLHGQSPQYTVDIQNGAAGKLTRFLSPRTSLHRGTVLFSLSWLSSSLHASRSVHQRNLAAQGQLDAPLLWSLCDSHFPCLVLQTPRPLESPPVFSRCGHPSIRPNLATPTLRV
jgi:hypothetical protein